MPRRIVMRMVTFLCLLLMLMATTTKTHALIPYPTRPSSLSLWDMTDDPFRILEQTPFTIPRAASALQDTLALARADWKETATAHVITLDIPGMKKEDVKIEVEENRVLRISGERKAEEQGEGDKWHRTEDKWQVLEAIKAHLDDGVLRITVPKFAAEKKRQPKLIDIAHHTTSSDDADIKAAKVA
ncbi:16.9 kDa class I heat shock protein 1-like isoform X2 [Prunus yedoensis var. nudiflora]|uniref:16.9 kDa class I heat shock protein 1-like isoform X2 n=1 Tax=Prunus yedoensis var. nudiflora TaxID=2094558 RepID=A0A314ZPI5_PRUYE|nr:16.9 kDa class I heat shock protein 1-like isoform X2 [Prunus yedoensis var. nudiflora]